MLNGWGCGQSLTASLCYSFLLTPFPCSSMGLSTGLQSFSINLLHPGPSMDSCQEPTMAWSGHKLQGTLLGYLKHPTSWPWCSQGCFPPTFPQLYHAAFCHFLVKFPLDALILATRPSCALWWGHWSWLGMWLAWGNPGLISQRLPL